VVLLPVVCAGLVAAWRLLVRKKAVFDSFGCRERAYNRIPGRNKPGHFAADPMVFVYAAAHTVLAGGYGFSPEAKFAAFCIAVLRNHHHLLRSDQYAGYTILFLGDLSGLFDAMVAHEPVFHRQRGTKGVFGCGSAYDHRIFYRFQPAEHRLSMVAIRLLPGDLVAGRDVRRQAAWSAPVLYSGRFMYGRLVWRAEHYPVAGQPVDSVYSLRGALVADFRLLLRPQSQAPVCHCDDGHQHRVFCGCQPSVYPRRGMGVLSGLCVALVAGDAVLCRETPMVWLRGGGKPHDHRLPCNGQPGHVSRFPMERIPGAYYAVVAARGVFREEEKSPGVCIGRRGSGDRTFCGGESPDLARIPLVRVSGIGGAVVAARGVFREEEKSPGVCINRRRSGDRTIYGGESPDLARIPLVCIPGVCGAVVAARGLLPLPKQAQAGGSETIAGEKRKGGSVLKQTSKMREYSRSGVLFLFGGEGLESMRPSARRFLYLFRR